MRCGAVRCGAVRYDAIRPRPATVIYRLSFIVSDQKRSVKSPDGSLQAGYSTNFGAGLSNICGGRGIEGQILIATFKIFISRLTETPKEIKAPENMVSTSVASYPGTEVP